MERTDAEREAGAFIIVFDFGGVPTKGKTLSALFENDPKLFMSIAKWKRLPTCFPAAAAAFERFMALPRVAAIVGVWKKQRSEHYRDEAIWRRRDGEMRAENEAKGLYA